MSQGVPVVVSRTKIDLYYFEEGMVHFFQSGDSESMAAAILDVFERRELRESLVRRGYEYVERHGWDQKKKDYLNLVDSFATEDFTGIQGVGSVLEQTLQDSHVERSASAVGPAGGGGIPLTSEIARASIQFEGRATLSALEGSESEKHEAARI